MDIQSAYPNSTGFLQPSKMWEWLNSTNPEEPDNFQLWHSLVSNRMRWQDETVRWQDEIIWEHLSSWCTKWPLFCFNVHVALELFTMCWCVSVDHSTVMSLEMSTCFSGLYLATVKKTDIRSYQQTAMSAVSSWYNMRVSVERGSC